VVVDGGGEGALARRFWSWWECAAGGQERVVAEVEVAFARGSTSQRRSGCGSSVHGL